jgi:hypothetical protein
MAVVTDNGAFAPINAVYYKFAHKSNDKGFGTAEKSVLTADSAKLQLIRAAGVGPPREIFKIAMLFEREL